MSDNGGHGKGHPALTEQDIDDIANEYLGGVSLRSLAPRYGVSQAALHYRMHQRGIRDEDRDKPWLRVNRWRTA